MMRTGLKEIISRLQSGSLSPVQLCEECISNAESTKSLNAFITLISSTARKQSNEAELRLKSGQSKGILEGIPVAVKDNFSTKGIRTTCSSKMLQNYIPPYTATVVEKLEDKGAVLIGKTNMDEFAMGTGTVDSIFGPVKNPWNSTLQNGSTSLTSDEDFHVAGGSSGGSAVAVATGAAIIGLSSDTGGSTRSPAAHCGIVGLKPTYGLLSRHGLIPLVNSLDVPGIMARTVDDAALILDLLAGHDTKDSTTVRNPPFRSTSSIPDEVSVSGLRVGIPSEYECEGMSEEVKDAWRWTSDSLQKAGAQVETVSMPHTKYSISCYTVVNACEVASNFARYDGIEYGHRSENMSSTESLYAESRSQGFNEVVRGRVLAGNYFLLRRNYEKYFLQALKVRRLIVNDFWNVFKNGVDLLLTPVNLDIAPLYSVFRLKDNREQVAKWDYCTQPVNMAGVPAVSVPIRLSKNGLPIGLQLIAPPFQEFRMLAAAKWIEQQVSFPKWNINEEKYLAENAGVR